MQIFVVFLKVIVFLGRTGAERLISDTTAKWSEIPSAGKNRFNMIARRFGDEKVKPLAVDVRWKIYMLFQIKTLQNFVKTLGIRIRHIKM